VSERSLAPPAWVRREVAVDFIDMSTVLDRMQRAFFRSGGTPLF
jgi:hypothetical protein